MFDVDGLFKAGREKWKMRKIPSQRENKRDEKFPLENSPGREIRKTHRDVAMAIDGEDYLKSKVVFELPDKKKKLHLKSSFGKSS